MLPIGDDQVEGGPSRLVTMALIAANGLAFLVELGQPSEGALQSFIQAWGVVPKEYSMLTDLAPRIPLPFWSTLFTSMFLHGGWAHLGGNMLFLWIFGDNLEKVMGHVRFLIFYLVCGVAAAFAHIAFSASSSVPTVGASGAISGVLGGHMLLSPKNRVRVLSRGGVTAASARSPTRRRQGAWRSWPTWAASVRGYCWFVSSPRATHSNSPLADGGDPLAAGPF